MKHLLPALLLFVAAPAVAPAAPTAPAAPVFGHQVVEIYRVTAGQQEAFLRFIDKCDEANRIVDLPPRQLFVHSDGADWDYMLIQPAETPKDKAAAFDAAWKKVGLPLGADFFFEIRKYIAGNTDTFVTGPSTAKDYLASATRP